MQNLTLQQLFGKSATQTDGTLTIHKADLPGLTVAANNRGEQLLVALLLQAHQHFEGVLTDEQGRAIADQQGRKVTFDNSALYQKLTISFWKRQFLAREQPLVSDTFLVNIFILPPTDPGVTLDPDTLVY